VRYSPWEHLADLTHVTFGVTRLPTGQGWWIPDMKAIALDDRLTRVQRRTVLAHELVHAERGDSNCHYEGRLGARQARRQEHSADLIAAHRLITLEQLVAALRQHPLDPAGVAEVLEVTQSALRIRLAALSQADKRHIEQRLSGLDEMLGA
jgi:Zn-dependent peptidase ImmA (M78 family)